MKTKAGGLIISLILILTGCKPDSLGEAIRKKIPFNVDEIVHMEKVKDGEIVLYMTKQKNEEETFRTLTVAFMKGSDATGWENAGHNHWEFYKDSKMTVYPDTFYDYDKEGNLENKISLIYGKIESEKIESIEVAGENKKYEKAKVIYKQGNRYFIKLGDYSLVRGLGSDGKVIDEQEG